MIHLIDDAGALALEGGYDPDHHDVARLALPLDTLYLVAFNVREEQMVRIRARIHEPAPFYSVLVDRVFAMSVAMLESYAASYVGSRRALKLKLIARCPT